MSDSERLKKVLEYLRISANQFSKDLGYERSEPIYRVTRGGVIGKTLANKIITIYPEFNLQWLLLGEGEMLKLPGKQFTNNQTTTNPPETMITEDRIKVIEEDLRLVKRMLSELLEQKHESEKKSTG